MAPNNLIGASQGPIPPTPALDIPDSNPNDIAILWEQVCPCRAMSKRVLRTGTSGKHGRASKQTAEADSTVSGSESLLKVPESEVAPGSSVSNTKPTTMTIRRPDFSNIILNARRIYVDEEGPIMPSAFAHFGTEKPQDGYTSLEGLSGASIWVQKDSTELTHIAAEYTQMRGLGLAEEEFASLAKEIFLLRTWRSETASLERQWRVDRMLQLVCPLEEKKHWLAPPILDADAADVKWSWDIRPDCAYWLSLNGFNPKYRFQVKKCTFVRGYITCPYFTVEFKRDGQPENVAINQVAAAGSLALYNRWRLHSEARIAKPTLPDDTPNIRHYALTFVGSIFVFWVLQPTIHDGQWNGCTMTSLIKADCADVYDIEELVDWINEVHRWGLSEHGPGCERDVKAILNTSGVRTSNIHENVLEGKIKN